MGGDLSEPGPANGLSADDDTPAVDTDNPAAADESAPYDGCDGGVVLTYLDDEG